MWLCLLALVAAACSGETDDDTSGTSQPSDGASAPADVQELVVGVDADPWVEAETNRKRRPNYPLNADVCETLVRMNTDFQVESGLADWEFVGDNTYRFTLKDGPTFSDGTPVTAEAVEYTIDYTVQEPQTGSAGLGPDSPTIVDGSTVDITPETPNLRLLEELTHPTFSVLAPGSDPLNDVNVTCTGPFEVVSYEPERELVVARNENYWGDPAELDKITFRFYPDDTTRTLALQNGEVDLVTEIPQGIVSSLEGLPGVKVERGPAGRVMVLNMARRDLAGADKILADPLVREAVAASLDQEALVEGVLDGNAEVINTVGPPAILGEYAAQVQGVPFDPDEAGRLLDQAGWTRQGEGVRTKDGQPLALDILFAGTINVAIVEFLQSQLEDVGMQVNIDQLEAGSSADRIEAGEFDLNIVVPNQNNADPIFLPALQYSTQGINTQAPFISPGPGTEFEEIVLQVQATADPDEVRRLAAEAHRLLVDVEFAAVPLAGLNRIFAMREEVQGVEIHPSDTNQRWSTVFISE